MRYFGATSCILFLILFVTSAVAQQAKDPVLTAAREMIASRQTNLIDAATEMPGAKYGFKPTPQQMTFGHLIEHSLKSNYLICSKISGDVAPKAQPDESQGKEKLVAALKDSFSFCSTALSKTTDSDLAAPVELFGRMHTTKAGALLQLAASWGDHYSAAAIYLRLNGLLPPTAKHQD